MTRRNTLTKQSQFTAGTDQPKRERLPKTPFKAPLRLSADEKKRIANSRRKLRAQQKRIEEVVRRRAAKLRRII
jgi:hypothetical protein